MITRILGGIILQILNMQGIYYLNKDAHYGNTNNFYRYTTTYEQARAWLKPLFRFWKKHHRVLKTALYLQILQIVSILCNLVIILVGMIHGFSDIVEVFMFASDGVVALLIITTRVYRQISLISSCFAMM